MQHRINHASSHSAPSRSDFETRFRFHPHPLRSNPTHPQSERQDQGIILQSPPSRPISSRLNVNDQTCLSNMSESAESIDTHTIPMLPTDADLRVEGLTFTQICISLPYLQRSQADDLDLQPKAFSELRHFHGQTIYSSISDDSTHGSMISSPLTSTQGARSESTGGGVEAVKSENSREMSDNHHDNSEKRRFVADREESKGREASTTLQGKLCEKRKDSFMTHMSAVDKACELEISNTRVQQQRTHLALTTQLPRDLGMEYDYIFSPHTASSAVSKASMHSFEKRSPRLSPVSPIAGEVLSQFKRPAENLQDLITFENDSEIKLHDRNNWPLPMSVQVFTASPLTAGFQTANSFNANTNNNDQEQTNDSTDNHFHVNDGDSRHRRTGFIIQDRTDSIASIHSKDIEEKLELSKSAMTLLRNAGKTPARSNTVKPSSVLRAPLSRRFSLSSGSTRLYHIQKDLGCDRSVAVLTPMSETFENLIEDHEAEFGKSHFTGSRIGLLSGPWLRWEFRGGLVGQG